MRHPFHLILSIVLCSVLSLAISAQHSPNTFIIRLDPDLDPSDIQGTMDEMNCTELGISALTGARLWRVNYFPFTYNNETIGDINGLIPPARRGNGVSGAGLNYASTSSNPTGGQPDPQNDCESTLSTYAAAGAYSVDISFFDTGLTLNNSIHNYYFNVGNYTEFDYLDFDNTAQDDHGHGTHITSIAAHAINKSYEMGSSSQNPTVNFDIRKTFNSQGVGYVAELLFGIEDAIAAGAQIINCSFNFKSEEIEGSKSPLYETFQLAKDYGLLVVAAAGNGDASNVGLDLNTAFEKTYPACFDFDNILTVTTYDCSNNLATFANHGDQHVDIAAPGIMLAGADNSTNSIVYHSGTSQSTALVSGIAASLGTRQAQFNAEEIICAIMTSAETNYSIISKVNSDGLIDAAAAAALIGNCSAGQQQSNRSSSNGASHIEGIAPNPASTVTTLQVYSSKDQSCRLTMIDIMGRQIEDRPILLTEGQNELNLDVSAFENGQYYLKLVSCDIDQIHTFMVIR